MSLSACPGRWKWVVWRHPEWWSIALSAAAWVSIFAWPHDASAAACSDHVQSPALSPHNVTTVWASELSRWTLMIVGMMFPLVIEPVRTTAARSLWPRRHRAIAAFLAGYTARWVLMGAIACMAVVAARRLSWFNASIFAAVGFLLALLWQFVPWKQRGLRACHRTIPLAPSGWRANRDCLHYGWIIGGGCLLSCWALMAACALAGHGTAAMACAGTVAAAERYRPRLDQRFICGAISAFGLLYATAVL